MKKIILTFVIFITMCVGALAQTIRFEGNAKPVMIVEPEKSTGLNSIYVLYDSDGVSMNYEAASSTVSVKWYKYGSLGGGYAEEIDGIEQKGVTTSLNKIVPNAGYIIEEGDRRYYFWVVNYSDYYLKLSSVEPAVEQDCGSVALNVDGGGEDIIYTTINGVGKKLNREIELSYNTLEWDGENKMWNQIEVTKIYEGFKSSIYEQAPLCNTEFVLSGDRFLKYWNEDVNVSSSTYYTTAIDVQTVSEQTERDVPNEKKSGDNSVLGGSAPVEITFTAYPTDAVAQREWQLSFDSEFETIERTYPEDVWQETFTETGQFYVRYVAKNASATCEVVSEVYTISVGESLLVCPNAFSPQGSPGVNDEWRVQYKSIVSFKCWIFNKWGVQICELNDPSQGWDGKYKGRYVGTGVYYYVIQAKGADGKNYKLKGDINIINYKGSESTSGNGEGVM